MKRSEINEVLAEAADIFQRHGWTLPPNPKWDLTDFGKDRFSELGLILVNLSEHSEYCEKLMLSKKNQITMAHTHNLKKEDIISRFGTLAIQLWDNPEKNEGGEFQLIRNGELVSTRSGDVIYLRSGERVTLVPGIYHAFWSLGDYCVVGEVSTANDDVSDNIFIDKTVGRFPEIEEDATPFAHLLSENL